MPVEEAEALRLFNQGEERITVLNGGSKWFIRPFIDFQYGDLNPENRVHFSILSILSKEGLCKPLASPCQGAKDKEKDKDSYSPSPSSSLGGVGEGGIPVTATSPQVPEPKKPLTDLQKTVLGWKIICGVPKEDKAWDKAHFPRCAKAAKTLLDLFGTWKEAVSCMEYVHEKMVEANRTCTIETVVRLSDTYRLTKGAV